uniref:Seizure related 6 homolog n=1 Tax=Apteryx owenii TaxID=8824 RepID=A0A8B9PI13_APTOW
MAKGARGRHGDGSGLGPHWGVAARGRGRGQQGSPSPGQGVLAPTGCPAGCGRAGCWHGAAPGCRRAEGLSAQWWHWLKGEGSVATGGSRLAAGWRALPAPIHPPPACTHPPELACMHPPTCCFHLHLFAPIHPPTASTYPCLHPSIHPLLPPTPACTHPSTHPCLHPHIPCLQPLICPCLHPRTACVHPCIPACTHPPRRCLHPLILACVCPPFASTHLPLPTPVPAPAAPPPSPAPLVPVGPGQDELRRVIDGGTNLAPSGEPRRGVLVLGQRRSPCRSWRPRPAVTPRRPAQVQNISLAEGETLTVESAGGLEPAVLANESFLLRGQVIRSPANLVTLHFQSPQPAHPGSYRFHFQGMAYLLSCPFPARPADGDVSVTSLHPGGDARFRCAAGYQLQGARVLSCRNATRPFWSAREPRCVAACGGAIRNATVGRIVSPGFPSNYSNNLTCHWLLEAPAGHRLHLHFEKVSLAEDDDRLIIRNGNNVEAPPVYDSYEVEYLPIEGLLSTGRHFFVELTTDSSGASTGMALRYEAFEHGHCYEPFVKYGNFTASNARYPVGTTYTGVRGHFKLYASTADVTIQFQSDPGTGVFGYQQGFVIHFYEVPRNDTCPELPEIPNGWKTTSHPELIHGTVVTYHCYPGFELTGTDVLMCHWDLTWSGDLPACERVTSCRDPGDVEHSRRVVSSARFPVGATVQFVCDKGYVLTGTGLLTCHDRAAGGPKWSDRVPKCIPEAYEPCHNPGAPANGLQSPERRLYPAGTALRFSCAAGHVLLGEGSLRCLPGHPSRWSGSPPICKAVPAGKPLEGTNVAVAVFLPVLVVALLGGGVFLCFSR